MARISRAYTQSMSSGQMLMTVFVITMVGLLVSTLYEVSGQGLLDVFGREEDTINAATWNIAAINNNPFEYWITWDNDKYVKLMEGVSEVMKNPAERDVSVKAVFTENMFASLKDKMSSVGFEGLDTVQRMWDESYKDRKIISGFLKDNILGKKRLASMPDRVTNTIVQVEGLPPVYRPTVINCYDGDLSTLDKWFDQWKYFIFDTPVSITGKQGTPVTKKIYEMLLPIKKAKYPTITEEEEAISVPLSTMCQAIFDAILVHLLNQFKDSPWMDIRANMCEKLNKKKNSRTLEILDTQYNSADLLFLQEVGKGFIDEYRSHRDMQRTYDLRLAKSADPARDQNSLILLKRNQFAFVNDVTDDVMALMKPGEKVPVANGDLIVIQAERARDSEKFLLASFHGDTNGLATKRIVGLVHEFATTKVPDHKLLFGMDANTYAKAESDQQDVMDFAAFYTALNLNSCYGKKPNPLNFTTFHARTYLQPQLNKAVAYEERDVKGDKNPKDFIVFFDADFKVVTTAKDNTGHHEYTEGMVFPTLDFPSDHGITSTVLSVR